MFKVEHSLNDSVVKSIFETGLGGAGKVTEETINDFTRVSLSYSADNIAQDDTYVEITPAFKPSFFWLPHLTPGENNIAERHIFRTPALIVMGEGKSLIVIPDVRLAEKSEVSWYLDLDAPNNKLFVGMSKSRVSAHVLFEKTEGATYNGDVTLAFYIKTFEEELENPFREVLKFFWTMYGKDDSEKHLG